MNIVREKKSLQWFKNWASGQIEIILRGNEKSGMKRILWSHICVTRQIRRFLSGLLSYWIFLNYRSYIIEPFWAKYVHIHRLIHLDKTLALRTGKHGYAKRNKGDRLIVDKGVRENYTLFWWQRIKTLHLVFPPFIPLVFSRHWLYFKYFFKYPEYF